MAAEYLSTATNVAIGGSANLPATNELPVDMYRKTWKAYAGLTPLTAILTRAESSKASNFRIDWEEENDVPTEVQVAAAVAAGGTTLTVSASHLTLVQDTLLYNPRTFDMASVDTTPTSNSITITRSEGGTTAAAWVSGDILHVLTPAIAEDDATYRNVSVADSNVYNYIQIVKMQYAITRLMNKMATHFGGAGSKRQSLKQQKYREFRKKWEKLLYFGGRASSGTAPTTQYMSGGLVHYLKDGTLYKDYNGIMTESGFRNFLGDYKDENPDATNILLACAGNVSDIISDFGHDRVRLSPRSKELGLYVQRYHRRGLNVDIIELPLLKDDETKGWGFMLDFDRIKLRTVDPPMFYPEALNVGESELIYDTYRVVTSLLIANESRHAMFVGAKL